MNNANLGNGEKFDSLFDSFVRANSSRQIKKTFDTLVDALDIDTRNVYLHGSQLSSHRRSFGRCTRLIYRIIKARTDYWKSNELWKKYDKKAGGKEYANRSQGSDQPLSVLIIGSGPVGLRLSIECALLGFKCTVVEKRDRFSRNNVLHLWPYTIHDLKSLGAKLFYGKFCAGSIDHISIRKLQCILLKVALLMGVQVHFNTSFEQLVEPDSAGWRVKCIPESHVVNSECFDAVIGADGRRNSLPGFRRKEFRGRLAIGITVNFNNYNTIEEQNVEERSGVAFIFDQKFFLDLKHETGIDLENIVYYKDDTHYFVMTAKRQSLLEKQVIKQDYSDASQLLSKANVNFDKLCEYAKEAAYHSTNKKLNRLDFAKNHYGQPDVAMFDFTSLFHSENASRIVVRNGHMLLMSLVGDSLLEPFWPLGTGIARGFLAALDTAWQLRGYANRTQPIQLLYERESIYQLLSQTTHDNIGKNYAEFTIDPSSRYANLNTVKRAVQLSDEQLIQLYDESSEPIYSPKAGEHSILLLNNSVINNSSCNRVANKRARIHNSSTTLLHWAQMLVQPFNLKIENFGSSWKDGLALLAIISRYKPHYVDYKQLEQNDTQENLHTLFDLIEQKLDFSVDDWAKEDFLNKDKQPSKPSVLSVLDKLYECFKGDPILDDESEKHETETEIVDPRRNSVKRRRPMTTLENESVPEETKATLGLRRRGSLVKSALFQNRIDFFNNNAALNQIERASSFNRPKPDSDIFESRPICHRCGLRISKADTVSLFDQIVLHTNCFRCQECNKQLRPVCFKHTINQNNKYTFFCNNHTQQDSKKILFNYEIQSKSRFVEHEPNYKLDVTFKTKDYLNDLERDKFEKRCNFYLSSNQTKCVTPSDSSNYSTPNSSFGAACDDIDSTPLKLRERAEFESILESEECNNSKEEDEAEEKANLEENIFTNSEESETDEEDEDEEFYSIDTKYVTLRGNAQKSVTPSTSKSKSQSPFSASSSSELNNKIIESQLNKQVDVYLMRKQAQEKAKLKSDEELGLNSSIVIKRLEPRSSSDDEDEDVFCSPPEIKRHSFDFDAAPLAKCETLEDDDQDELEPKLTAVKPDIKLSFRSNSNSCSSNDEFSSSSLIDAFNALNVNNSPRLKRSGFNRKRVMNEEKKMLKQNQDRRLRMSQELQRKLEELRNKKDEFSKSVCDLEKRVHDLDKESLCYESVKKTLESKIFNLIHCKNLLIRIENELIIQSKALGIEDQLSECQLKLKETIDLDEESKTAEIREREKWLMERLVDLIEEKDRLVDQLEKLKMMEIEEDRFVLDFLSKEISHDFFNSSNDLFQQFKSFNDII